MVPKGGRRADYKIQCVNDGRIFDTIDDLCEFYHRSYDSVAYRLDHVKDYQDGYNFVRVYDDTEAVQSAKAIDTRAFEAKYGDKTVPIPGYENKYTISTNGVIRDITKKGKAVKIKTNVTVKHKVVLHKGGTTMQTHDVINLMKKAFGDPDAEVTAQ